MKARCKKCDSKSLTNEYHAEGCEDNHREHVHRNCKSCGENYTVVPADTVGGHH